ncbi:MAG: DUF1631 family protein [Gammaproteobacteria bacterium]
MDKSQEIIQALKEAMLTLLLEAVGNTLDKAYGTLMKLPVASPACTSLKNDRDTILERFRAQAAKPFDELTGVKEDKKKGMFDYASLSLVEEDDLEAIIALEGMVSYARNNDVSEYIKFNTRLDTLFYNTRIDESNSPMDPEQLGDAFQEAMRPVGLKSAETLTVYREFNKQVFHNLEKFLSEANALLAERGILPDLGIEVRIKKTDRQRRVEARPEGSAMDRAFSDGNEQRARVSHGTDQVFSMLQQLMHASGGQVRGAPTGGAAGGATGGVPGGATGNAASMAAMGGGQISAGAGASAPVAGLYQGMMIGKQKVEIVSARDIKTMLGELLKRQDSLDSMETEESGGMFSLSDAIGELLQESSTDRSLKAIDTGASDVVNLMHLLFEFIREDETVPSPMKSLLGRTQIPLLMVALEDPKFFDNSDHCARSLVNELSTVGISWTETAKLAEDPMYLKLTELMDKLGKEFHGNLKTIEELVEDLLMFKRKQLLTSQKMEQQLKDIDERKSRLEEINQYAKDKVMERVLDPYLDPFAWKFLENYFQKFVAKVILKEGPGGVSWKPIMNTVDVLLWTLRKGKSKDELKRFEKVNPRLLANLRKALGVAGIEEKEIDDLLSRLERVQRDNSSSPSDPPQSAEPKAREEAAQKPVAALESEPLPKDDPHLKEVDNYPLGMWLEFALDGENTLRCSLAAKIAAIDKFVFVNSSGVKVIEKSRMGLARELKAGTVKLISQAPLFDRALESVISTLRQRSAA